MKASSRKARARGKGRVLVLCALPYPNGIPHVGNMVGSHLPADIFARYCRIRGYETILIGGTDENGTPTTVAALELKVSPARLTETLYRVHKRIYDWFSISYDNFSRTSLPIHHETTQEFFKKIYEKGFITEGVLRLPYCERDGLYLADRYVEGTCPSCGYQFARGDQCEQCTTLLDPEQLINPRCRIDGSTPIFRETRHLFLELGKLKDQLERWIKRQRHWRKQVTALALGWIREGLKRRCITRDLKWGVPVPLKGYEDKVFYVWFDAPIGYISSTKEWAQKQNQPERWRDFWLDRDTKIYNFLGKDNIPFHTIFWPAMLMAHGEYNLPYEVVGLQFCNYEGDKISKSRNWGIFCEKVVEAGLHPDIWRYYFAHLIPETKDTEFKWEEFENRVNNELVANIGNFIHRTLSFIWNYFDGEIRRTRLSPEDRALLRKIRYEVRAIERLFERVRLRDALGRIVQLAKLGNEYFQRHEPWRLVKTDPERCRQVLYFCANLCNKLAILLYPYLPSSSQKILEYLGLDARPEWRNLAKPLPSTRIKKPEILFRKLERGELERVKALVTKSSPLEEYFREPLVAPA